MNTSVDKKLLIHHKPEDIQVKILLVDDRNENLISLESLLKKEDEAVEYIFSRSGEEALKIALQEELALILLDVQMPGMNGYEVAEILRSSSRTRQIPIIFVTAIDQESSRMIQGFEAGAVDFLFKPLHPVITRAKVAAFVKFHQQKKALEKANAYVLSLNRQLEERVAERTLELQRINIDLDNFIYTASHDLKAPISNIEGLLRLFYNSLSPDSINSEKVHAIQAMIDESISRFKTTLKDLTEVAKLQNEENEDKDIVSFAELLEDVKLNIAQQIEKSGAVLEVDFSQAPTVEFSRKNLRSILYNLVSNAIKYKAPDRHPHIIIKTIPKKGFTFLTVEDNGLGIRKKDHEKVFGMFKRVHAHVEGSGVGMAIVKRIVENTGGKIELDSELGKGSCFKVYLA